MRPPKVVKEAFKMWSFSMGKRMVWDTTSLRPVSMVLKEQQLCRFCPEAANHYHRLCDAFLFGPLSAIFINLHPRSLNCQWITIRFYHFYHYPSNRSSEETNWSVSCMQWRSQLVSVASSTPHCGGDSLDILASSILKEPLSRIIQRSGYLF